jgi:hypothetical protein
VTDVDDHRSPVVHREPRVAQAAADAVVVLGGKWRELRHPTIESQPAAGDYVTLKAITSFFL